MKRLKRNRFTIMELMGVLIIMGLMMGIIMNSSILRSSATVNAGVQMLSSQMRLARQYAITHRVRVAVLLPEADLNQAWDSASEADASDLTFRAKSFRSCVVDDSNVFESFIENTSWSQLPTGAVMFETGELDSPPVASAAPTVAGVEFLTADPTAPPETLAVRGLIFKPDGSLLDTTSEFQIVVAQGTVIGTEIRRTVNAKDEITCKVNWLTGAITFKKD